MSARAWQARKPGPNHLTGAQRRWAAENRRQARAFRRMTVAVLAETSQFVAAMNALGVAAKQASDKWPALGDPR